MEGGPASYAVKRVNFFGRNVRICMQNNNGPCPLLAIANVLSLRNELKLPSGIRSITQSDLITAIVDLLLERSKHIEEASAADYHQTISDIFPVLQKLTTGIDVNVKFHNCHAFEATPEVAVFDLLGIPLVHGWLVDPQDTETAAVFGNKSYNELVEVLLHGLDAAEKQKLVTGPLRNLSFTPSHSNHQELPHDLQSTLQPCNHPAGNVHAAGFTLQAESLDRTTTAADTTSSTVAASSTSTDQQISDQTAPPQISTRRSHVNRDQRDQQTPCPASAFAAVADGITNSSSADTGNSSKGASLATAQHPPQEVDGVIEQLVEEMMQHVCCDVMPGTIELGESPTVTPSINRRLAYEGKGSSTLSKQSTPAAAPVDQTSVAYSSSSSAPSAAVTAGASGHLQQQQPSSTGALSTANSQVTAAAAAASSHPSQVRQLSSLSSSFSTSSSVVIRQFMEVYCSQLTHYGLLALTDCLKEHQLAVFFRNNHFNTLFKYEGGIYLLVTDQGYECEPDIVWERLDTVNGDTTFCTGAFSAFVPHRDPNAAPSYRQVAAGNSDVGAGNNSVPSALTDLDAAIAASLAAADGSSNGSGQHGYHQQQYEAAAAAAAGAVDHEDADFALALQLQLQEEEAIRLAQEQQQQSGRVPQQQQRGQQQQQQQYTAESLAAGVRQVGRRIVSSAERAASSLQQQRQQYVQQQQAMHAAEQQERAATQQQQQVPHHHRQFMLQQERQQRRQRQQRAQAVGGGSRRSQQEDKCSIM